MWTSIAFNTSPVNPVNLEHVLSGKVPATVIRNFYDKKYCQTIADRVENRFVRNNIFFRIKNTVGRVVIEKI